MTRPIPGPRERVATLRRTRAAHGAGAYELATLDLALSAFDLLREALQRLDEREKDADKEKS